METRKRGPGRPRKPGAPDAAERMRAARERKRRAGFRLHQGWVNAAPQGYSDHQRLDARSLALHCLVARKLLANPALIAHARNTLARWRAQAAEPVPSYFLEWGRILEGSPGEIAAFLASMREDATRLRQSSPFTNFLTPEERARIFEAFR
jgi:hypothetical protein